MPLRENIAWRVFGFLRPTLILVVAFIAALGIANATFLRPKAAADVQLGPGGLTSADLGQLDIARIVLPKPELTPAAVVQLQLDGLRDVAARGAGILQCYVFASPGNRLVTGPLDRFGHMVRRPPFDCLGRPRSVLIGRPQIQQDVARLLVTVVDEQNQIRAFTFVLARQKGSPVQGCWMTDAVLPAWPWPGAEDPPAAAEVDAAEAA